MAGIEGFPGNYDIERFNGSNWRYFQVEGGGLVLTNKGQELFRGNPQIRHTLKDYRAEALRNKPSQIREWFRAGANGDVYLVGNHRMVMKEASTAYSVWNALDRMDHLYYVCANYMPEHVRVPEHYGALFSSRLSRQYLLMAKANDGFTVAEMRTSNAEDDLKMVVEREFIGLEDRVREAITKVPGRDDWPSDLLPDWDAGNVIVDFSTPANSLPFTFWIIDQ